MIYDGPLEDFYTPRGVERWIFFILIFYVRIYKNKQTKSHGPTWGQ